MFEYVCDHVIPGCTTKETGETPEAVREKALEHLEKNHDMAYIDGPTLDKISLAIVPMQR
jgi:predicted small metal-binding protein